MKLCSQCEFIYEDNQERCEMDGAELVYEPTLEHVFPENAVPPRTELERRGPTSLIIPFARLPQPATSVAQSHIRSKLALQIAAVTVLAAVTFMAFYAAPRLFPTTPQTLNNTIQTQAPKLETAHPVVIVSNAAVTSETPETQETKSYLPRSSDKPETRNAKLETPFPALPGLKPLPRLRPLPTLKPIPRLSDRSRPASAGTMAIIMNTKVSANPKKESRWGSFLKRTGRILTKPF